MNLILISEMDQIAQTPTSKFKLFSILRLTIKGKKNACNIK